MVQGGGWLCGRSTYCSADGKYLFVVIANTIRVYSVDTGLLVSALSEHKQVITACVPNPRNDGQVRVEGCSSKPRIPHWQVGVYQQCC